MSSKRRSMFVVAALLSGTVFLTACSSDDVEEFDAEAPLSSSSAPATAPTSAPTVAESSAASSDGSGKSSTGGGTSSDTTTPKKSASTPAKTEAAGDGATTGGGGGGNTTIENINDGKGVSGTWFGNLKYLAPSKYTVSGLKGVEQQFFVANDTEIWGAGEICGDAEGQSATECTEAQLEAATQGVGFTAEVVVVNGIATKITEDHS